MINDAGHPSLAPVASYAGPIAFGAIGQALGSALGAPVQGAIAGGAFGSWLPYSNENNDRSLHGTYVEAAFHRSTDGARTERWL